VRCSTSKTHDLRDLTGSTVSRPKHPADEATGPQQREGGGGARRASVVACEVKNSFPCRRRKSATPDAGPWDAQPAPKPLGWNFDSRRVFPLPISITTEPRVGGACLRIRALRGRGAAKPADGPIAETLRAKFGKGSGFFLPFLRAADCWAADVFGVNPAEKLGAADIAYGLRNKRFGV